MQDTAPCVIDHPDYKAMVNKAVLLQVGPLLKGRNGKSYRRRPGVSLEEYVFFYDLQPTCVFSKMLAALQYMGLHFVCHFDKYQYSEVKVYSC